MKSKPQQFLSDQEFFDAAWNWLVVENRPQCACPTGDCFYRDGDRNCVVGAFIPEELYALNFPDQPITVLLMTYPEFRSWFAHVQPVLLQEVEEVHNAVDSSLPTRESKMRRIAECYDQTCP